VSEQKRRSLLGKLLRWGTVGTLTAALTVAAYLTVPGGWPQRAKSSSSVPPPIRVTVAAAARRDVPIYLTGLGTVQAFNTVAVHTQIDGKLQSIAFVEGQEMHKGDLLVQIDPRFYQAALDQAKGKQAQDEAQLVSAQKDLARAQSLVAKSFETQQNVDHQTALVGQLKASIQSDKAAVESAQTQLDYTRIVSPNDGRVGIRQIDVGNIVHVTDAAPVVVVTQTKPIAVIFSLPEKYLDSVRAAFNAKPPEAIALDPDNHTVLGRGTLLLVDNIADTTTGTIRLKAVFPNEDERLWPGEFVNAQLLVDTRRNAVTVPSAAVQRGPQGLYAWFVDEHGTALMRPIQVGATFADHTVVTVGLNDGDQVVIAGQSKLAPGTHVAVAEPDEPAGRKLAVESGP